MTWNVTQVTVRAGSLPAREKVHISVYQVPRKVGEVMKRKMVLP